METVRPLCQGMLHGATLLLSTSPPCRQERHCHSSIGSHVASAICAPGKRVDSGRSGDAQIRRRSLSSSSLPPPKRIKIKEQMSRLLCRKFEEDKELEQHTSTQCHGLSCFPGLQ